MSSLFHNNELIKFYYYNTFTIVHGNSGKASATAIAPASLVEVDKPIKNSRPVKTVNIIYIDCTIF